MGLKAILNAVFTETTNGLGRDRRYCAKSLNGGTGWQVWDRRTARFLSSAEARLIDPREPLTVN